LFTESGLKIITPSTDTPVAVLRFVAPKSTKPEADGTVDEKDTAHTACDSEETVFKF
jgi:hypothetical protein